MRKQPRIAAALAAVLLSTATSAVVLVATAAPASATTFERYHELASRYRVGPAPATEATLARLRQCESGGNYASNTGNGYYGAYQFSLRTWRALGYTGRPDLAPPAVQDEAAATLQARSGWGQWPGCSRKLRLR
jgi:hypothetical protein